MKRCLIVGRPNVGKTTFALGFAAFLAGSPSLAAARVELQGEGGRLSLAAAQARLVGPQPHTTLRLQKLAIRLPGGKGRRSVELVDTAGLDDGVHPDPQVRGGMAETLRALQNADLVLHLVDAAQAGQDGAAAALGDIDRQIARFASLRGAYAVLANKLDLIWARAGYLKVRDEFPDRAVIPVSALRRSGFREVRTFVWDRL